MIDNTENSQRKNKIEDTEQSACTLCPRDCKKNRADGEIGVCGETAAMRIGRAALHMWEEPCISGEKGSGAVFYMASGRIPKPEEIWYIEQFCNRLSTRFSPY